jgi:LacI family transcriptional regulator
MIKEKKSIKEDIILNPLRIITRRSTETLAVDDAHIKTCLLYIKENLNKPIHTNDLLQLVPLSRRVLEKKFSQTIGNSIYKEIQRQRIEKVVALLLDTNLPVSEIASFCGFPDSKNLSRLFRETYTLTPLQFRKNSKS